MTSPGQKVLERTDCEVRSGSVTLRFEVGFPANGRTINARELEKILFDFLPVCVEQSLLYARTPKEELSSVIALAEDQHFIREELTRLELAAFVADGSILPRESGISDRPMKDAIPFSSPEELAVKLRYSKLTEEEKQWLTRIVHKSELAKSYVPQRGKRK